MSFEYGDDTEDIDDEDYNFVEEEDDDDDDSIEDDLISLFRVFINFKHSSLVILFPFIGRGKT